MVCRAAAPARAFPQRAEQGAQQRAVPLVARAQQLLQLRAQPLDFLGADVLRAGAKGAVDAFDGLGQGGMRRVRSRVCRGRIGAQLELEQPALRRIGDLAAVHFQRADFGERCGELHQRLPRVAGAARLHHGGNRRQADEIAAGKVGQLARLIGRVGDGGDQVEAHRMPEAQGKGAVLEMDLLAVFGPARQQANAALRLRGIVIVQDEEVAARRAPADARRMPGAGERERYRATGDRHVGVVVVQHMQGHLAPGAKRARQTPRQRRGAEHAAVEQQGVGHRRRVIRRLCCVLGGRYARLGCVLGQEGRNVPGDRRVRCIRQAKFDDAAP